MKIVRLDDCPITPMAVEGARGVAKQVPIGRADGSPTVSVRVFTVEPGGHTPHHAHEAEHVNYVLSGEGVAMESDRPRPVRQGDFILVKPNEVHRYRNTGNEPLIFMCVVPVKWE